MIARARLDGQPDGRTNVRLRNVVSRALSSSDQVYILLDSTYIFARVNGNYGNFQAEKNTNYFICHDLADT